MDTGGSFSVAMDSLHLGALLLKHTTPPPDLKHKVHPVADRIYMGFPCKKFEKSASYSFEGRAVKLSSTSYECPRCSTRTTDIPGNPNYRNLIRDCHNLTRIYLPAVCGVCSLQLNSSSHIARSHHHLFPVPNYLEDEAATAEICFACKETFLGIFSALVKVWNVFLFVFHMCVIQISPLIPNSTQLNPNLIRLNLTRTCHNLTRT